MSRWNRPTSEQQTINNIIQTHFNSINILAHSIQNSQEIIHLINRQNTIDDYRENIFDEDFNMSTMHRRRERQPNQTSNVNTNARHNNSTATINSTPVGSAMSSLFDPENSIYYFTFDANGPPVLNNVTNVYAHGASFETLLITEANKDIINQCDNSSNDADISQNTNNYHLYEISHFDLIENPMNDVCPITRERFDSTSERILMIKKCKHVFNKSALKIWLEHHNTCPCCRGEII